MDRKRLALIHIVKKELNLSDKEYRKILSESCGVSSAKDLTQEKFRKLMNYFVRSEYYRLNPQGLTIKQKLYIKYIAGSMGWDQGHLNNFIYKYYHRPEIDKLTRQEAIKLIESLKNVAKHKR